MKKTILFLVISVITVSAAFAQNSDKKWGVGLEGGTNEYSGDLGSDFLKLPFYGYGGLSIGRYICPSFDLGINLTYGDYGHWEDTYYNFLNRKLDGSLQLSFNRITSYNVCYTKLLRWRRRAGRPRNSNTRSTKHGSAVRSISFPF